MFLSDKNSKYHFDQKSKYHFDQKCDPWKMLVGEHVLRLDSSRNIIISNTPARFSG